MCVVESVWLDGVVTEKQDKEKYKKKTTKKHNETPTNIETKTHNQCDDKIKKVAGS